MNIRNRAGLIILSLLVLLLMTQTASAHRGIMDLSTGFRKGLPDGSDEVTLTLIGWVANTQDLPVDEAEVRVFIGGAQRTLTVAGEEREVAHTSAEGFYIAVLTLPPSLLEADALAVEISKPGFRATRQGFARQKIARAGDHYYVRVPDVVLPRVFNPAFFLATGIFLMVFGFISLNLLHETIAAFLGAAAMLGVSYFVGDSNPDFWIVSFHRAIQFIDFDVIFLLMTMMIFMAIMSRTGIFQWLAYQAFRLAQGNAFLVAVVLVSITGLTSAVLNDTTVMLLMAPVSIQIALALKIHPAAIVVPEVLASNIGGAATLIASATQSPVTLLHVIRHKDDWAAGERTLTAAREMLPGLTVDTCIRQGDPIERILANVRGDNYDLVVIGANQGGGVRERLLGSVAQKIVRRVPTSVLVASQDFDELNQALGPSLERVLICTGGAAVAEPVIETGAWLAGAAHARGALLHVVSPPPAMYTGLDKVEEPLAELLQTDTPTARHLRHGADILARHRVTTELKLRRGVAPDEILREADEGDYDLVVIGASGAAGRLKEWLLGNVTRWIVEHAPCSVLVVKQGYTIPEKSKEYGGNRMNS